MIQLEHHWQPAGQHCHAIDGTVPSGQHHEGELITTLCGKQIDAAEPTALNWLWPTCGDCLRAAERMPGGPS